MKIKSTLFLYLDFLGFKQITEKPETVRKLFTVLDESNIHRDTNYRAIVFSDTLIAYNSRPEITVEPNSTELMYLIELVQDITHRLTGSDIFFRAFIKYAEFEYKKLGNIDAYFGKALHSSQKEESDFKVTGLFLQNNLVPYDKVFTSVEFSSEYHMSLLSNDLIRATFWGDDFPITEEILHWREANIEERVLFQVDYLQSIREGCYHPNPSIRSKFLNTWAMYEQNFRRLTETLINHAFQPESLCEIDWEPAKKELERRRQYWQN